MDIFTQLKYDIKDALNNLYSDLSSLNINIEIPKDPLHGDLSTNVAMMIAGSTSIAPREIAIKFKEFLTKVPYIAHIEIAGPGFINFTIKASFWQNCIKSILEDKDFFDQTHIGNNKRINIEYVSANPTGPMHIGHARGAIYGDVLANILSKCGYLVTKEYYVNDAGTQIDNLVASVFLRYKEAIDGQKVEIPEGLYPGEYLILVGKQLVESHRDRLLTLPKEERVAIIKKFVVAQMLNLIKKDLYDLGIVHDVFISEQDLHDKGAIDKVIDVLQKARKVYTGYLPPPKGQTNQNWEEREQLLFKATEYGDDQDRPLQKANKEWTYLAADVAYAQDKIERGFQMLIYILGADHTGYVRRINAIVRALSNDEVKSEVRICQLVNFVKNGQPFKMSKRQGNFTTTREVIEAVGKDIIRFMMILRKNDTVLEFDLAKVKEQTKENPIFYVQYAHVRAISIIQNAKEKLESAYNLFIANEYDLLLLSSEKEIQLIKLLASWPKVIEACSTYYEPHRLALYLIEIATKFHALWNLGKENNEYRFIIVSDPALTSARLALAATVKQVISKGLNIIGVEVLEKM